MTSYINIKVHVSEGQKDKIAKAIQAGTGVSLRLSHSDLNGEHVLALTQQQVNKIAKAYRSGRGVIIKMSKAQLEHNTRIEGGFIGALLPFLATAGKFMLSNVLPSLATGALTGIGSAAGSKIVDKVSGSALYIKSRGTMCKIVPHAAGLYLRPYQKESGLTGNGLFIKTGSGFIPITASGLITGDSQISRAISNVPLIGPLLSMII